MSDLGKICAGRGAEGFETQRKGPLWGTSQPWQHVHGCVHGNRLGLQKTLFGFQLFCAVELFWTSGSSSVQNGDKNLINRLEDKQYRLRIA